MLRECFQLSVNNVGRILSVTMIKARRGLIAQRPETRKRDTASPGRG